MFLQVKIKVRELMPYIGLIPKVIPLKLFLDMVPSSSADVPHALRGCLCGGDVKDALKMAECASSKLKSPKSFEVFKYNNQSAEKNS